MKTLILDNYDSFTFNLYQAVSALRGRPVVYKNDEISIRQIKELKPTHIIISPGPGTVLKKKDFGVCGEVIKKLGKTIPLLGVCLGHQGIIAAFGGKIKEAPQIMHGKTSRICLDNSCRIFKGLPKTITAMRYHSLIGDNLPKCLTKIAFTKKDNLIMGVMHTEYPIFGIQFHPESFKTPEGELLLRNFLQIQSDR